MVSHIKSLLKKELYLLKHDWKRIIIEFIFPVVIGIAMLLSLSLNKIIKEEDLGYIDNMYVSSTNVNNTIKSVRGVIPYSCLNYIGKKRVNWIGLVTPDNNEGKKFKQLFSKVLDDLKDYNRMAYAKEFKNEDELLKFAKSSYHNGIDSYERDKLCIGIKYEKSGNSYDYKIYMDKLYATFRNNLFDELSLYLYCVTIGSLMRMNFSIFKF